MCTYKGEEGQRSRKACDLVDHSVEWNRVEKNKLARVNLRKQKRSKRKRASL